jgi:hypothetical protein
MALISRFQAKKRCQQRQVSICSTYRSNARQLLPYLVRRQATQNNPRTQERHTSLECNKSSLLVCDVNFRSARINDFQAIRATDLTLGFRRIPAGFHVVVKADGAEFQTSNKSTHVDQAVVEWDEPILL